MISYLKLAEVLDLHSDPGKKGVFYRILIAPPGYAPPQNFMVGEYTTLNFESCPGTIKGVDGSKFFPSLEEARKAIPQPANRLPSKVEDQFIELWESLNG